MPINRNFNILLKKYVLFVHNENLNCEHIHGWTVFLMENYYQMKSRNINKFYISKSKAIFECHYQIFRIDECTNIPNETMYDT